MQATTYTVVAMPLLLLVAGAGFLAGRANMPEAMRAATQTLLERGLANSTSRDLDRRSLRDDLDLLYDVLNRRMDFEFGQMSVMDLAPYLTKKTGVMFHVCRKRLEESGVSPDAEVRGDFKNVRLRTFLDLTLDELDLTYMPKHNIILITTPEHLERELVMRVYDCRDLLAMEPPPLAKVQIPTSQIPEVRVPEQESDMDRSLKAPSATPLIANQPSSSFTQGAMMGCGPLLRDPPRQQLPLTEHDVRAGRLIDLVTEHIRTDTWNNVGGPGSISEYHGLIVISQTCHIHDEVERFFDMLREAAGLPAGTKSEVIR